MRQFENILVFYKSGTNETTLIDIFGNQTTVEVSIMALLESLCATNGLSLEAAFLNSRKILKAKKNPPINLCYKSKHSYFRVVSISKKEQLWIRFSTQLKCRKIKNGNYTLAYQGKYLMDVDIDKRKYRYQFDRIFAYYHNDKTCPVQDLLSKKLGNK